MSDMNDRVALITGASSGIGRTTGDAFAARGAKVVLASRREHELATLTSAIESRGGKASFVVRMSQSPRMSNGWWHMRWRHLAGSTTR